MRIIAVKTLKEAWQKHASAKESLLSWYEEVELANWKNPPELKIQYRNASIINKKRVVFNIHGNNFRLVVDIEYRLGIIFIVWFGTHDAYNKIEVKNLKYVKTH